MLFLIPKVDTQELTTIDYKVTEIWSCTAIVIVGPSTSSQPRPPCVI